MYIKPLQMCACTRIYVFMPGVPISTGINILCCLRYLKISLIVCYIIDKPHVLV